MAITLTQLRSVLYRLIDEVIETGRPLVIDRNGHTVVIGRSPAESKLAALIDRREVIAGAPAELVDLDFTDEWRP